MKYEQNQPTVRSRASILTTDIEVSFYEKHQVDEILPYLIEHGYSFMFETEVGDSLTLDRHTLTITDVCWARNVKELFEELEKLDHNGGEL